MASAAIDKTSKNLWYLDQEAPMKMGVQVITFHNDDRLQYNLQQQLERFHEDQPKWRIVSVTSHPAQMGGSAEASGAVVVYSFFYYHVDLIPDTHR